jgi:hypothetical protein
MLGGSGESRPLPIRVILQGFFAVWLPTDPVHFRPFATAPLENVRKTAAQLRLQSCALLRRDLQRQAAFPDNPQITKIPADQ